MEILPSGLGGLQYGERSQTRDNLGTGTVPSQYGAGLRKSLLLSLDESMWMIIPSLPTLLFHVHLNLLDVGIFGEEDLGLGKGERFGGSGGFGSGFGENVNVVFQGVGGHHHSVVSGGERFIATSPKPRPDLEL